MKIKTPITTKKIQGKKATTHYKKYIYISIKRKRNYNTPINCRLLLSQRTPMLPITLVVPPNQRLVLEVRGRGVQEREKRLKAGRTHVWVWKIFYKKSHKYILQVLLLCFSINGKHFHVLPMFYNEKNTRKYGNCFSN